MAGRTPGKKSGNIGQQELQTAGEKIKTNGSKYTARGFLVNGAFSVSCVLNRMNGIMRKSMFLTIWKHARVILIPKPAKPMESSSDLRPLYLFITCRRQTMQNSSETEAGERNR